MTFEKAGDAVAWTVRDEDLVTGALALAYAYVDPLQLTEAYAARARARDPAGLVTVLRDQGRLSVERAQKLERASRLLVLLRDAAIYGTVALNNKLIGEDMLNACMEEGRRKGFASSLGQLLQEKGVLNAELHQAISGRCRQVLEQINANQQALARAIDWDKDEPELAARKVEILMGEVASQLGFLTKERLEDYLQDEERVRLGLPASEAGGGGLDDDMVDANEPIAGYEILSKLGQGAMGAVFKAKRKASQETVALKVLKPDLSNDHEFVQRFLREAKAVARLNHPNIIRAIDVGRSGRFYYFAMEFIEGQTCSDIVKRQQRIPERSALKVCKQVALALDHAWSHKIIHRDVKPDNIMVMKDGTAKLTDLGLARTAKRESTLTLTGVVMGSPAYISPEQATGEKNLDNRSDIYSLGATLYHMLTGSVPFDGDSPLQVMLRHMNDPLPDVRRKVATISEGTRQLIFKMMAKRPESRFQNARELYNAIVQTEKLLAGATVAELSNSKLPAVAHRKTGVTKKVQPLRTKTKSDDANKAIPAAKGGKRTKQKEIGDRLRKLKKRRI